MEGELMVNLASVGKQGGTADGVLTHNLGVRIDVGLSKLQGAVVLEWGARASRMGRRIA